MQEQREIEGKKTRIFFTVFFIAILSSIALTYYTIHVQKQFTAFSVDDVIPEPTDVYVNIFNTARQFISGMARQ